MTTFRACLKGLDCRGPEAQRWREFLLAYTPNPEMPEDYWSWTTCVLALQAVCRGNFGIGSLLLDGEEALLESGHNEVFSAGFRSDFHAEMVVMTRFEDRQMQRVDLRDCTLYTSLESCPMCLCRLITSGVGHVFYVAADDIGGMVRRRHNLPPVWQELMQPQEHRQAKCSDMLKDAGQAIFLLNVEELNRKLAN